MRVLQGRFVPVALEAQGLQVLGLRGEGLVHGDDVVQLARRRGDGRRAELALVSCRPVHDFVMASEYVAVCRIRDALATVPSRYLKAVKTDCVVFQDLPKKFQGLVDGLVRQKHPDGTPVYRCEEVKGLEGQYRIPRIEAKCPYY